MSQIADTTTDTVVLVSAELTQFVPVILVSHVGADIATSGLRTQSCPVCLLVWYRFWLVGNRMVTGWFGRPSLAGW